MFGAVVLLGLIVGSFLNVVIVRVPERRSLWGPRSQCPGCGTELAWHDNIPVLSFIALRGRCRSCGMAIAWQYPLVEIATGGLFGLAYLRYGPTTGFMVAAALLSALVVITAVDLRHQIIPDVITLPGTVAGFLASVATKQVPWHEALLGIALGGGLFFVIIFATRGGMGGGDMKLGAMLGAFLGYRVTLVSIFVAVVLGGTIAGALLLSGLKGRKDPIPFGPFLAVGGVVGVVWRDIVAGLADMAFSSWYAIIRSGFGG